MAGVRPMSQMRKLETKEAIFRERKRILKCLVHSYLRQRGLMRSAQIFKEESSLSDEFEVCDNIDLDIMLQDYCSYYMMRFDKQPQFIRRIEQKSCPVRRQNKKKEDQVPNTTVVTTLEPIMPALCVQSLAMELANTTEKSPASTLDRKPFASFLSNIPKDMKPLAEMIYQDIVKPLGVAWGDVVGLDQAKSLMMESIVYPIRYPDMFTGLLEPWRGVLLHGPPGTGKTLLAKAVASEAHCTFFNVTCSTVINKWRGESEKIIKVLFDMATYYSPSIIFIDEIETLASDRSSQNEHEASRRLQAQLLTELDGISRRDGVVFLLANTNLPWTLDTAMLRRLEKRIHIPLPDFETRRDLFRSFLDAKSLEIRLDFNELADRTDGYSGSDIKVVCKEALMVNVRKMLLGGPRHKGHKSNKRDSLSLPDVLKAIEKTRPISREVSQKHIEWQKRMGCS